MQIEKKGAFWRIALIIVITIPAGSKCLAGQEIGETSSPVLAAGDTAWPEVNLNVVVLDKRGVPQKVNEKEFQIFDDGGERPLQIQGSLSSPVSLVLLVDSSASVLKRRDAILAAVKAIVKGLPEGSEVAAVDFNYAAYIDLPFTDVSKADFTLLDGVPANGSTALYDAIIATEMYIARNAKYARRALVIVSDGEDNASHKNAKRMAFGIMQQIAAPIVYACVPSKAIALDPDVRIGHINMKYVAEFGGGFEFYLEPDPETAAAQIAETIRAQYVLRFKAADPTRNGKGHKLAVRLPDKDLRTQAQLGYFAPAK